MKTAMKWWSLYLCIFCSNILAAQKTDSLWAEYNNEALDSITRITSLHRMGLYVMRNNPDSALKLADLEQDFARAMDDTNWIALSYNVRGSCLAIKSDFAGAMDKFYRMLDLRLALNDTSGIAEAINNMGNIYYYQGDYPKALEFYIRSLNFEEKDPSPSGLAASY